MTHIKRYIAFGGDNYYPFGGAHDMRGNYDTIEEAQRAIEPFEWCHILDTADGAIICEDERPYNPALLA